MELLFEFLGELLLEGSIELSSNKKISKFIRYPLIFLLIILFGGITFGIIFLGLKFIKENFLISILFIILGFVLLIGGIFKFRKIYLKK